MLQDQRWYMLYQLIGRAGRIGKSKSACVVFMGEENMRKTFSSKEINVEAQNIEIIANNIETISQLFFKKNSEC